MNQQHNAFSVSMMRPQGALRAPHLVVSALSKKRRKLSAVPESCKLNTKKPKIELTPLVITFVPLMKSKWLYKLDKKQKKMQELKL